MLRRSCRRGSPLVACGFWGRIKRFHTAWTHKRHAATRSFDHLIGALLEMQRNVEAERLGGLEVNHQLELDGGLDRKLARLRAPQDAINIGRCKPKLIALLTSVGQQAAQFRKKRHG